MPHSATSSGEVCMNRDINHWDRREFLRGAALAGAAGLAGLRPTQALAEPPPETTKIRLLRTGSICWTPQYIAEPLL